MILQGIDLPSKNQSIVIEIKPNGICPMMKVEKGECYELTTKGEVKAIQIPKGHGRLIDGDALENTINYDLLHRDEDDGFSTKSIWSYIKNAPTILGAEGAE